MTSTPPREKPKCELCGETMPNGEEMFKIHGYSGNCPKPPISRTPPSGNRGPEGEDENGPKEY